MSKSCEFSFADHSIAKGYDEVLVPVLFEPWAARFVGNGVDWAGSRILDLATGTGVVARFLAGQVGPKGRVIATDINGEMLSLAKLRCDGATPPVQFVLSPASPLELPDAAVDYVVCQQGFQFFPDRRGAAGEVFRVLCEGGRVFVSTWCPVQDCEFFGAICVALNRLEEEEMADMMRVPFDRMPDSELAGHFSAVGFEEVEVRQEELPLLFDGGVEEAVEAAFATPIGPRLRALPSGKQEAFRNLMRELLSSLSPDGVTMGRMVSNVLEARRPGHRDRTPSHA